MEMALSERSLFGALGKGLKHFLECGTGDIDSNLVARGLPTQIACTLKGGPWNREML